MDNFIDGEAKALETSLRESLRKRYCAASRFMGDCLQRQPTTNKHMFSQRVSGLPWNLGHTWTQASHLVGGADVFFQASCKQRHMHTTWTITEANITFL